MMRTETTSQELYCTFRKLVFYTSDAKKLTTAPTRDIGGMEDKLKPNGPIQ
ncbi:conserved hypothetical protein [Ricinus communis]|uniref:Uncharacterized protein n=1 Tax=Ricinus communis TaxID=3988 RepID=B9SPT9_RICCO|nr:conserved hypothetical protein [Ricinus communis]